MSLKWAKKMAISPLPPGETTSVFGQNSFHFPFPYVGITRIRFKGFGLKAVSAAKDGLP
jgi:hypothetical protein